MSVFDDLATGYDRGMLPLEVAILRGLRQRAFASLQGRVLELGVGTGVNLPLYTTRAWVVALERSGPMVRVAAGRRTRASVRYLQADVHSIPFPDAVFDAVASSLLFCSVADPLRALAEVRRVLRPGGRLVMLEHTRGNGLGGWLTDLFNPLWLSISRECHLNRETDRTVVEAGFRLVRQETHWMGIFRLLEGVREG